MFQVLKYRLLRITLSPSLLLPCWLKRKFSLSNSRPLWSITNANFNSKFRSYQDLEIRTTVNRIMVSANTTLKARHVDWQRSGVGISKLAASGGLHVFRDCLPYFRPASNLCVRVCLYGDQIAEISEEKNLLVNSGTDGQTDDDLCASFIGKLG